MCGERFMNAIARCCMMTGLEAQIGTSQRDVLHVEGAGERADSMSKALAAAQVTRLRVSRTRHRPHVLRHRSYSMTAQATRLPAVLTVLK